MRAIGVGAFVLLASCFLACGSEGSDSGAAGGGGAGGGSGTECSGFSTKTLDALTSSEVASLCDCVAAMYGGYGTTIDCGDGGPTVKAKDSQQDCVDSVKPASCTTVSAALDCAADFKACNLSSAACTEYIACVLGDGG